MFCDNLHHHHHRVESGTIHEQSLPHRQHKTSLSHLPDLFQTMIMIISRFKKLTGQKSTALESFRSQIRSFVRFVHAVSKLASYPRHQPYLQLICLYVCICWCAVADVNLH
jgi:hypothetical protein